ncbi:hypothetical protein HZS_6309, partial [Henneguya salminicola]
MVKALVNWEDPTTASIEPVQDLVSNNFCLKPLVISERYKFWSAEQKMGESLKEFALRIQKISKFCMFENFLDQALCDKFILGLNDQDRNIRPSLLSETNLDFKRSIDIAVRIQSANSDSTSMAKQDHSKIFWVMTKKKQTKTFRQCYYCGEEAHLRRDFPERIRNVRLGILKAMSLRLAEIRINGHEIVMEIDTGSPILIINSRNFYLLGSHYEPTDANFVSFSGHLIKPIGVSEVQDACLFVLMGQTFLEEIGLL